MSDPFRMYEAARKHMYTAMERESDPPTAIRGYQQALDGFAQFLAAAAKNRGMYKELVGHHPLAWQLPCPAFCFRVRPSLCLLDASPPPTTSSQATQGASQCSRVLTSPPDAATGVMKIHRGIPRK